MPGMYMLSVFALKSNFPIALTQGELRHLRKTLTKTQGRESTGDVYVHKEYSFASPKCFNTCIFDH